jgi:hypothetical protein
LCLGKHNRRKGERKGKRKSQEREREKVMKKMRNLKMKRKSLEMMIMPRYVQTFVPL